MNLSRWRSVAAWLCAMALTNALAQEDAQALLPRANERIESYRQTFLKTGNRAKPELEQAALELTSASKQRDPSAMAEILLKLGDVRRLQNRHGEAIEIYQRALAAAQKSRDATKQAQALIGQGRCEIDGPKDLTAAAAHFDEAVKISEPLAERTPLFNALGYVAQVQVAAGNLVGAADLLNRALALAPEIKDQSLLLFIYIDRGDVFEKLAGRSGANNAFGPQLENLKLAQTDYEAALALCEKHGYGGIAPMVRQFLRSLGVRRQMAEGNARLADKLAASKIFAPAKTGKISVSEEFATKPSPEEVKAFELFLKQSGALEAGGAGMAVVRGNVHSMKGESDEALAAYLEAADLLEADRRALRDETSRGTFFEDKISFYYPAISELLQRKRYAEAFELMERSRSRALADLLFNKKLSLARPEEQALYGEAQGLRAEIAQLQTKLFDYRTRPEREQSAIKSATQKIAALEKEERDLAARMGQNAPRLRELLVAPPASLARVQEMLRRDDCEMLYYLALESSVILWHIAGDSVHVRSVFLPRTELKAKLNALRKSVATRDATFDESTARDLFAFLIQPALGWVKSGQLVIIPHAEMHQLPFAALIGPDGKALGERFALSDAPNAGVLLELKKSAALSKGRLLAAADPGMEAAREEVAAVAGFYSGRNKTVLDPLITESEVKASAAEFDVLHLSVHGKFTPAEPMLSHLQLAEDTRNDGRLTAAEMFGLPLSKAPLVVLSACQTGQVEATAGNEILGMERALLFAGANNLVLSGWPVDAASTALWMKTFHREAQQKPLAEAARLALVEVKGKYPEPYHWAAFRLVGK